MSRKIKIWLIGAVIVALVVMAVITTFEKFVLFNAFDADHTKYVEKTDALTKPAEYELEMENPDKIGGILRLRALLSDNKAEPVFGFRAIFVGLNFEEEAAYAFLTKDEERELDRGCFLDVLKSADGSSSLTDSIGLVNVDRLCRFDFADELFCALEDNSDSRVRLDEYAICDYLIIPLKITLENPLGEEIVSFSNDEIPADYTKIDKAAYIGTAYSGEFLDDADSSLLQKMRAAFDSDSKVKEMRDSLIQTVEYSDDKEATVKTKVGFGSIIKSYVKVNDRAAMIEVTGISYEKTMIVDLIIVELIWALICVVFIFRGKKGENK